MLQEKFISEIRNHTKFRIEPKKTSISSVNDGINFIVDEQFADSYFVIDGQNFVFDGQKVQLFDEALKEHNLE